MNYLGFDQDKVSQTGKTLNLLLANYQLYYQNLRNFHWNISGEHFFDLHEKFEELYNDARLKIDEIAERLLTLRIRPMSTLSAYLDAAEVQEAGKVSDSYEMVEHILQDHKILIKNMRTVIAAADDISDEGTIDLIGGFLSDLEKKSWMLDAWLANTRKAVQ
ncbi:MAG: DNA starvation/stationary phase protection protein [Bacteroidetes bacterium]|nr:MAG: DNA starvation/stationary phase protection protein [Bacteroidota bacterium]